MGSFVVGALLPLLAVVIAPHVGLGAPSSSPRSSWRSSSPAWSARGSAGCRSTRQVARNVAGGLLAMAVTYGIGVLVGPHL